ncbi:hypothetical protein EST38_g3434 [Candolleomyces aberdarensis]|uniref:F-box domain-containing protein n=1 Tax=Candolleomyces aberdarensis TaxID=2316362 RepID=A0A4Q2DQU4_9AGAR|nr:hypothetical protein EST38_g3434 [Candolleomyces aberdarensis]
MSTYARPFKLALPQELIDKVVDETEDDSSGLKALSLVGTQWSQRARKHMFREIRLMEQLDHPLDPKTRCRRLLELLESNDRLRKYPQTLVIQSSTNYEENMELEPGWLQICSDNVIEILSMLQNVSVVILQEGAMRMNFSHLPLPLRAALHSFISRPEIIDVTLSGIDRMELIPLVQHPSLKNLSIGALVVPPAEIDAHLPLNICQTPFNKHDSNTTVFTSRREKNLLQKFSVCGPGTAFCLLLAAAKDSQATLRFHRITVLEIGTLNFDFVMVLLWQPFLHYCCKNVVSYSVTPGPVLPPSSDVPNGIPPLHPSIFSLDRLPKLKHLHVRVPYCYLPFPQHNPLPHLLEALENLSSPDGSDVRSVPLQTLDLGIDFANLDIKSESVDVTGILDEISRRQDIWGRLDETLSLRHVFSQLTTVNLHMLLGLRCKFRQSMEELDELNNTIHSYMPKLGEQIELTVAFHIPAYLRR